MIVILPRLHVERPGRPPELTDPVVRGRSVGTRVSPNVPVAIRTRACGSALNEPGMPIRGVVWDIVQDQLHAPGVHGCEQPIEVVECSENRINGAEIGDVVAEILHGRGEDRRQPDGVDAERHEMVEPRDDAVQVADAVAVGVLKGARIDLVDDAGLPPWVTLVRLVHKRTVLPRRGLSPAGSSKLRWRRALRGNSGVSTRRARAFPRIRETVQHTFSSFLD